MQLKIALAAVAATGLVSLISQSSSRYICMNHVNLVVRAFLGLGNAIRLQNSGVTPIASSFE